MRRLAVALFSLALLAAPLAAPAQPAGQTPSIAVVLSHSPVAQMQGPHPPHPYVRAFLEALRQLGHVEGQNIRIERRSAEGRLDQLPVIMTELTRMKVDVIVTATVPITRAAQQATRTIPIVIAGIADPIAAGLVASLARPGGNVTGTTGYIDLPEVKLLEVLKDAVPTVSRVGVLYSSANLPQPVTNHLGQLMAAAQALRVTLLPVDVDSPGQVPDAFAAFARQGADTFLSFTHGFNFAHRSLIVNLANQYRWPSVYLWRESAELGGLLAYGPNLADLYRQAATYVDKVLKGAKPADLPIRQPTTFDFAVNLKTAKGLGLTIPPAVLARETHVIE
jgi:putative ABC transport system substrate-binding protein